METINPTSQKYSEFKQTSKFNQEKFISFKNAYEPSLLKDGLELNNYYLKVANKQLPKISAVSPFGNNLSTNMTTQGQLTEKAKPDH
jgi:hypothetical protein